MKWLIYGLLVANLAVFAWHYRGATAPEVSLTSPSALDVPPLALLGEAKTPAPASKPAPVRPPAPVTPPASVEPPEEEAAAELPPPEPTCRGIGPFAERAQARAALGTLAAHGVQSVLKTARLPDLDGYWVLLPPFATRAAAKGAIDDLKEKGVKDYFLVATGEMKNAISLGVFSREELAERRMAAMLALGFKPEVQTVPLPQRDYWLGLPGEPDAAAVARALALLREAHTGIDWLRYPCPEG